MDQLFLEYVKHHLKDLNYTILGHREDNEKSITVIIEVKDEGMFDIVFGWRRGHHHLKSFGKSGS